MRKLRLALLALALASPAAAQNAGWPPPAGAIAFLGVYNTAAPTLTNGQVGFAQLDINGQLKVAASVSATVTPFAPGAAFATLTATGSSADVALPTGATVVFYNTGTTAVSCTMSIGAGSAVASENVIQPSSWLGFAVGSNTHGSCIDQTGSASNVVVLSGGSGLPAGSGGGAGGYLVDPCQSVAKTNYPITQAASTKIVSGTGGKKNYVCSILLIIPDAEKVSITEGSGSACGTSSIGLVGSTTVASGMSFAANGGLTLGNGAATVIPGGNNGYDLCVLQSGTGYIAGNMTVVQQ